MGTPTRTAAGRAAARIVAGLSLCVALCSFLGGCHVRPHSPGVTALPASPWNHGEPPGIPYYLPKPLLVISKNFHHVETPTVGLTDSAPIPTTFDEQETYAGLNFNANYQRQSQSGSSITTKGDPQEPQINSVSSPPRRHSDGAPISPGPLQIPKDGLAPHTFFTYEIIFVPDLTQKYVLQVQGGPGEMRAAINLVNGWMFTGLGPYYLKDSSTAQNLMARGLAINLGLAGASDVITSVAQLRAAGGKGLDARDVGQLAEQLVKLEQAQQAEVVDFSCIGPGRIERYAEIYVYEPYVAKDGTMQWRQLVGPHDPHTGLPVGLQFHRDYLGAIHRVPAPDKSVEEGDKSATGVLSRLLEAARDTPPSREGGLRDPLAIGPGLDAPQPGLVEDIVERTLETAQPREKKHGWFRPIFPWKRSQRVERVIDADVAPY